jgi:hypothetical protein
MSSWNVKMPFAGIFDDNDVEKVLQKAEEK